MYKNGGGNPRQPVEQDLAVSPNINALRATDSYLYVYYMLFSTKYQLVFQYFLLLINNEYTSLSFPVLRLPVPCRGIPSHIFHKIRYDSLSGKPERFLSLSDPPQPY